MFFRNRSGTVMSKPTDICSTDLEKGRTSTASEVPRGPGWRHPTEESARDHRGLTKGPKVPTVMSSCVWASIPRSFLLLLAILPTGSLAYAFGWNAPVNGRLPEVRPSSRRAIGAIGSIGHRRDATPMKLASSGDDPDNRTERSATAGTAETENDEDAAWGVPADDGLGGNGRMASTNTINERLMAELQQAEQRERFGPKSAAGKKLALVDGFGRRRKTDEEVRAAIAEARDLNGVNPTVAIVGSFFAFAVAAVLWVGTNRLGVFFASHPPETDVYFVIRTAQVFRNVVMGLISLASGFFGVTGMGIFLLGVRVAFGVMTGELDPTPIKKPIGASTKDGDKVDFSNVWDMMMNKKPGRRGGSGRK